MSTLLIMQCLILNIKSKKILYAHCKYSCIYICRFKENANHLMPVFQHSKLEVWSRILFLALQSLGVGIAILRVLRFWMLCTLIGSSVGK